MLCLPSSMVLISTAVIVKCFHDSDLKVNSFFFHSTLTIIINFCFLLNVKTSISLSSCFFYVIHQFVIVLPINYAISGFKLKVVITICCQNFCKKNPNKLSATRKKKVFRTLHFWLIRPRVIFLHPDQNIWYNIILSIKISGHPKK